MTNTPEQPEVPPTQPPPAQPPSAPAPAKQDLTMAWLPHLLMVLTWWLGPLIIWLVKKDEDKLAAFHGKQAMIWGFVPTALFICIMVIMFIPVIGLLMACFWPLLLAGNLAYGIYAIIQASKGKPFKYFFVADKFCAKEFAEAYPDLSAGQQQTQPPAEQPPTGQPPAGQ